MKTVLGKVISDKMIKSAIILIERSFRHPLYGKILTKKKKIHASNDIGAKTGDLVQIVQTRPISKTISHKIVGIIEKISLKKKAALKKGKPSKPRGKK